MKKITTESVLTSWVTEYHQCGDFPDQVQIRFDGHAEDEDGNEDPTQHCYHVLVHKDSATDGFVFEGHERDYTSIAQYYVWINDDCEVDCISDGETDGDITPFNEAIVEIERRYQEG